MIKKNKAIIVSLLFYLCLVISVTMIIYWCSTSFQPNTILKNLLSSIGLFMDLIGVLIIAHMVIEQFRGVAVGANRRKNPPVVIRKEFQDKQDEASQIYGYWFIAVGFFIQIVAIWI